jgi:hypothetical protein
MSINFYFTTEKRARIEKMRSEFMTWNEKVTNKMEEHMRTMESFSVPCSALVSQSSPITPQSAATITKKRKKKVVKATKNQSSPITPQPIATVRKKRKKKVVKATKIHPCWHQTKSSSTSSRAAHLRQRPINQQTQPCKRVTNHRTVSSHVVIKACHTPMPFWSSSHTSLHGSFFWLMRKNSIVFDSFRKRKKNFILVLEIFLGDKKIVREGNDTIMIESLLLRTYLD